MLIRLANLLPPGEIAEIRGSLEQAKFMEGTMTGEAGLKNNLQTYEDSPALEAPTQKIFQALMTRAEFRHFAMPKQMNIKFNRYDEGMYYGKHMDAALMGGLHREPFRTDLSFTLFLNDASDYDGGELIIDTTLGELRVKDEPGTVVVYPSTMIHRVDTVTRGHRLAAIGWIQSMIRGEAERSIILELESLRRDLKRDLADARYQERINQVRENLIRIWAEV